MLELTTKMVPPSIVERVDIMRSNIRMGGVPFDYDRMVEYSTYSDVQCHVMGSKLLKLCNSNQREFTAAAFSKFVKDNNLTVGFNLTSRGNISLDASSIDSFLNTNAYSDSINDVVRKFKEWNYYKSQTRMLPEIIQKHPPCGLYSEDGRRVVLIKPTVHAQNTGRFGLRNPGIMNLPRYMTDLVVAPKGWTIVSADSGQIEPKLTYGFYLPDKQIQTLIALYGDAYYALLHYCQMPAEDIRSGKMDFVKAEITDELKAKRQRLKTYCNGVMYGSTSNKEHDPLKQAFIDRIGRHPLRAEWIGRLEEEINSGKKIFYTLFGTPIDIYNSKKYLEANSPQEARKVLSHCVINNPIQGSAGDLMAFSLRATNNLFHKKAPNSWITKFVHDEGQYCINNDELDYVLEEVKGHTSYRIDGRVEIYNDPIIGREIYDKVPFSYDV